DHRRQPSARDPPHGRILRDRDRDPRLRGRTSRTPGGRTRHMKIPAVFLSHGAPTLAVEEGHETRAWAELGKKLPRPRSILAVSAHWDTRDPEVSAAAQMQNIH